MCTNGEVVQQHGQGDGFIASADSAEMTIQFIRGGGDEVGGDCGDSVCPGALGGLRFFYGGTSCDCAYACYHRYTIGSRVYARTGDGLASIECQDRKPLYCVSLPRTGSALLLRGRARSVCRLRPESGFHWGIGRSVWPEDAANWKSHGISFRVGTEW